MDSPLVDATDAPTPPPSPTPPRSYRFYWVALATSVGALLVLVAVYGVRGGRGLADAFLFASLLCLITLAFSLVTFLPRWAWQGARRLAVASALGLIVSFVGFGLANDENRAGTAVQIYAHTVAHGVQDDAADERSRSRR